MMTDNTKALTLTTNSCSLSFFCLSFPPTGEGSSPLKVMWRDGDDQSKTASRTHHLISNFLQNITTMTMMRVFLALLLVSPLVASFQLGAVKNAQASTLRTSFFLQSSATDSASSVEELQDDDDEFSLTQLQVKALRKEMNFRKSTKVLTNLYLSPDEGTGPFSKETMEDIVFELKKNEMVTVRAISKEERKDVHNISARLAMEVGMEMEVGKQDSVYVLDISGHAATLYCPSGDEEKAIKVRTTGKANNWSKRVKAERDSSGQIIPGTAVARTGRRGSKIDSE